ncbi:MAG: alpha/beta fold hydrolase [Acidimicrobiales bacterium]
MGAGTDGSSAEGSGSPVPGEPDADGVRYQTIHGYRRAYRLAGPLPGEGGGDRPALLLLHGIGDSSDSWLPVLDDLAEDVTVLAPDLLGHGRSDKPRADYSVGGFANGMRDLLEVLGIERVTVVGHSLGGGVAAQFAYQYPERCDRLVLVSSGGVGRAVTPFLRFASAPYADLALPLLQLPPGRLAGRLGLQVLRLIGHDLGRDAEELQRVFDGLPDVHSQMAFTRTLRAAVDLRGQSITMRDRAYLARFMPTMVVWGEHDGVIPVRHAHLAALAMPDCRLEIHPEAGHFPHHTDPERFVADLRDFLATTEPATHRPEDWRVLLREGPPVLGPLADVVEIDTSDVDELLASGS